MSLSIAVIGAGPAGTTAARLLADRRARVVLFEARRLPRDKICGGGLTRKAERSVPRRVLDTVERRVHRAEIRGGRLPALHIDEPAAEVAMVRRAAFDMAMAEAAAAAGAVIRDGERVDALSEDERGVTLTTHRGPQRFDLVVAADGVHGTTSLRAGLGIQAARRALALDIELPLAPALPQDTAVVSFDVPGAYAWYFPKRDHANVGIWSSRTTNWSEATTAALRRALARFTSDVGLDVASGCLAGHWIPYGLASGPLATRRIVIAGDAASTADPFFGEGISYAICSAMAAVQTIADVEAGRIADLRPYDARLRALLRPAFRRLDFAAKVVGRSPTLALAAYRLFPWVRTYAVDIVAGRGRPFGIGTGLELA